MFVFTLDRKGPFHRQSFTEGRGASAANAAGEARRGSGSMAAGVSVTTLPGSAPDIAPPKPRRGAAKFMPKARFTGPDRRLADNGIGPRNGPG